MAAYEANNLREPSVRAEDIVESTYCLGYESVYFLGPYAHRVSFSAQQHRALNLVWALEGTNRISPGAKVAVIGAGLAGLTTVAALISRDCIVSLFEKSGHVLWRQRAAHNRYVHPTINRWPFVPLNPTTEFPFLAWRAERCDAIVHKLENEWQSNIQNKLAAFNRKHEVLSLSKGKAVEVECRDLVTGHIQRYPGFDAAIVATGFDNERLGTEAGSYWMSDSHSARSERDLIVVGTGDGGLIDALRLTHNAFQVGEFIVQVAEQIPESYGERVRQLELQVSHLDGHNAASILDSGYRDIVSAFSPSLNEVLDKSLVDHAEPTLLVSRSTSAFGKHTAPIHKLLLSHAITRGRVVFRSGTVTECSDETLITFADGTERRFKSNRVLKRLGAENSLNTFLQTDELQDLQKRQSVLMERYADQFWPVKYFNLATYPPHDPSNAAFRESRFAEATRVATSFDGVEGLSQTENGFEVHISDYKTFLKSFPNTLFGIPVAQCTLPRGGRRAGERDADTGALIRSGSIIRIENGRRSGILAGILKSRDGHFWGLTSAHVLSGGSTKVLAGDAVVGATRKRGAVGGGRQSIDNALAIFSIGQATAISAACDEFLDIGTVVPQRECLGISVRNFTSGRFARGKVRAIGCPICFDDEFGDLVIYNGAFEVEPSKNPPFAAWGESGALVTDDAGRAVGIIIGEAGSRAYLAPIAQSKLLDKFKFIKIEDAINRERNITLAALDPGELLDLGEMPTLEAA